MRFIHKYRGVLLFIFVCFLSIVVQYLFNNIIVNDDLLYDFYVDRISLERITDILSERKKLSWPSFVIPPFFFFVKFCLIAVCFSIAALLVGHAVDFGIFFYAATVSEIVLISSSIVRILWFSFVQTDYTLQDIQYFMPLSIINLFDPLNLDPLFIYPLRLLNGFEVMYWFALAYLLKDILRMNILRNFYFVACSYGIGLLIWCVFIAFITVNFS